VLGAARPLAVVPIHTNRDWGQVLRFLSKTGLLGRGFHTFSAAPSAIQEAFGRLPGLPTTFRIDAEGRVA
jgi:hypothetical protein